MDKLELTEAVITAKISNEIDNLKNYGKKLCNLFEECPDELYDNKRRAFHIGTAFYFYRSVLKDKEELHYKFSIIAAYLNLFDSLQYQDGQSLVAAYRLHILTMEEKQFFDTRMLSLIGLNELFSMDTDEVNKLQKKFYFTLQYCLFNYCKDQPLGYIGLLDEEKKTFENIYKQYRIRYKDTNFNNQQYIDLGRKLLNSLYERFKNEDLGSFLFLGTIA